MAEELNIKKLDGMSLDVAETDKERLKAVFPQCFVEGKLDIDKLLSLCGEYIDNDFEKYKFEWKGKSECLRIAGKRSTGTLRPCPEESVDFENTNNLYIEGDNLEVLKLLQTAYYRKVKMIYIDPPYNTGNDFVYEDNFKDPLAKYKEITSQTTKSNPETMGRYHTNWLNMMYPRLRLAANLLRDDGVIFISIDDNEITNLRRVCDEVFGEENFIAQFAWNCATAGGIRPKFVSKTHEYILTYAKQKEILSQFNAPLSPDAVKQYNKTDEKGTYREKDFLFKNPSNNINQKYGITCPDGEVIYPKDGYIYRFVRETFDKALKDNTVVFKKTQTGPVCLKDGSQANWNIYIKKYLGEGTGCPSSLLPKDLISIYNVGTQCVQNLFDGKRVFENVKPVDLINYFLQIITRGDDIILDFFSGSATTAHAVMQLNAEDGGKRQFIMVQLPELTDEKSETFKAGYKNICEIGKERIRRAGCKIKEQNANVDVGFKVLKLDTSNLVKWDDTPLESSQTSDLFNRMDGMIESIKKGRSELDVVYEVMLKLGIPATYQVFENNLNGRKVYSIGEDGLILVCLDGSNGGITPEDITAMCELAPAKIVAAEEAFKDDVALSNAYYISKDSGVEIMLL